MTTRQYEIWIYGPQVTDGNRAYDVGGDTWWSIYENCMDLQSKLYNSEFLPKDIYTKLTTNPYFLSVITHHLKKCTKVSEILLIHSALINAYGLIRRKQKSFEKLFQVYDAVHKQTTSLVGRNISIFLTPAQFRDLGNSNAKHPKNIIKNINIELLNSDIKLFNIPSVATSPTHELFEKVQNATFRPFVDKMLNLYNNFKENKTITDEYIVWFKKTHRPEDPSNNHKPPIVIRKKPNTYLSQLFEKTCILLYRPYEFIPKSNSRKDIKDAVKSNLLILQSKCSAYAAGNIMVFNTPISEKENDVNVPVFFIKDDDESLDLTDNSVEFFNGVLKELLDMGVFIKINDTDRYELNDNFDIDKLECYKALPNETKTPELKKELTEYFFIFIGNIIHFAVTNNLQLPFKLSRFYIGVIFNVLEISPPNDETKELIITIFFFEKANTEFKKEMIKILEDDAYLQTLTIYHPSTEVLKGKVNNYFYNTALAEYLSDKNAHFFKGFNYTKNFDSATLYPMNRILPRQIQNKIDILIKADLYLCGV